MPTIRRRTPPRRDQVGELTKWTEFQLDCGPIFRNSVEEVHSAWRVYRGEHLARYVETHPGRRPWAWWMWDAPHDRRVLNEPIEPDHYVRAQSRRRGGVVLVGNGRGELVPWLESEAEYLTRHKLWLPGERGRWEAAQAAAADTARDGAPSNDRRPAARPAPEKTERFR